MYLPIIVINIKKIENDILSKRIFNDVVNQLKRRYFIDFQDKFPPGYDKQRLVTFLEQRDVNIDRLIEDVRKGRYKFSPFIERKVPKTHKKALVLCQGCLRDVIVQIVFNKVMTRSIQNYYSSSLYSGRSKNVKINIHSLIKRVYKFHKESKNYAIKLDIRNYYNEIDKRILEKHIKKLFGQRSFIFKTIKNYIYSDICVKGKVKKSIKGIHIGSHLANILSNIYLTDFDKRIHKKALFYARYADDIFVICEDLKEAGNKLDLIKTELQNYKLRINNEKFRIIKPRCNFEYLGFEFKEGQIYIRQKSIKKFKNKIKRNLCKRKYHYLSKLKEQSDIINDSQKTRVFLSLINDVNKLISGNFYKSWIRYFSKATFSVQFHELDIWIKDKIRQKLTGKWSSKNYKKFSNDFFHKYGLRSMVRQYYRYNEKWKLYSKPLPARIASLGNLEKAADYYLDRNKGRNDYEAGKLMSNRREFLEKIQKKLLDLNYEFSKPRRKSIKRQDTAEIRSIYTVNLEDKIVQRAIINVISSYYDSELSEDVYSYRKGRSVFKAISKIIRVLRNMKDKKVYKSDFKNFNESIDLDILKRKIKILFAQEQDVLKLFCALLNSLSNIHYLPKGMPLTNFLLNIYLIDFDEAIAERSDIYIRYADDFLVFVPKNYSIEETEKVIKEEASKLHLKLNEVKTKFVGREEEFEFLGYKFAIRDKLKISLSDRALSAVKRRIRRLTDKKKYPKLTKRNYKESQDLENIIKRINYYFSSRKKMSVCKYFCRVNDFGQLKTLDLWICDRLRLAITKRMHLKNRSIITDSNLKELGLISLVRWICLAKQLMYNKLIAYQYQKVE